MIVQKNDSFLTLLPKEIMHDVLCKLNNKEYATLSICAKILNEMTKNYSKIGWPIIVTPLKELSDVTFALHHVGCGILAVEKGCLLKRGREQLKKINEILGVALADEPARIELPGLIYDLADGKLITDLWFDFDNANKKSLAYGLIFPYESKKFEAQNRKTFFSTDSTQKFNYPENKHKIEVNKTFDGNLIQTFSQQHGEQFFTSEVSCKFFYSENKEYLIYQNDMGSIIIQDMYLNAVKTSYALNGEILYKFIYHDSTDHLVFYSRPLNDENLWVNILDIKSEKLLHRFSMNNISFEYSDLLLYLPEEKLLITSDKKGKKDQCIIFDLKSEKIVRKITLEKVLPVTQLSFRNNALYITQHDHLSIDKDVPNCMITKIDFLKNPIEIQDDCACNIL